MSPQAAAYAARFWAERRALMGPAGEPYDRLLAELPPEEREALRFLLATVPLSDLGDYPPELLLSTLRHGLALRREEPRCAALPEALFLLYVLPPRVNDETLSDCRPLFAERLAQLVRGLDAEAAALAVNRWCAGQVCYRSTDARTASALETYRLGWGRCGEESVFTVNALRSVGIAARQVYAPWWAHCDDNHAWVEVWTDGGWHYLGACEPEPRLDRGWFTAAAARAMLIRARHFLSGGPEDWGFLFSGANADALYPEEGTVCAAVTSRYAETAPLCVAVEDENGRPVSGARVRFSLLNMAAFRSLAVLPTGEDGTVSLRLGLGDLRVSCAVNGRAAEAFLRVGETEHCVLRLGAVPPEPGELFLAAPRGLAAYPPPLPPEERAPREIWLGEAAQARAEKQPAPAAALREEEQAVLDTLPEKARAIGLSPALMADALSDLDGDAREVSPDLLCPLIGREPLFPWRQALRGRFSPSERAAFARDPAALLPWLDRHVRPLPGFLCGSPAGALKLGAASRLGRAVLFAALCRALGVPARLSPLDGVPAYTVDGETHRAGEPLSARLTLCAAQAARPEEDYCLCRFSGEDWLPLATEALAPGVPLSLALPRGKYRLITAARLPSGDQLARVSGFSLAPGQQAAQEVTLPRPAPEQLLMDRPLPPALLPDFPGGGPRLRLAVWASPGEEPSVHMLGELSAVAETLGALNCGLYLLPAAPGEESALAQAAAALPGGVLCTGGDRETLARALFLDPARLPLVLLARENTALYGFAGYNVGAGRLLAALAAAAQN